MSDRAFGMLRGHIGMTSFAMLNTLLQMLDPFIDMRILPCRPGMLESFLTIVTPDPGMPPVAMRHGFLRMLQGFGRMLVSGKGEPAEQGETNKRGNRRNDHYSAMDSHSHGSLLSS